MTVYGPINAHAKNSIKNFQMCFMVVIKRSKLNKMKIPFKRLMLCQETKLVTLSLPSLIFIFLDATESTINYNF